MKRSADFITLMTSTCLIISLLVCFYHSDNIPLNSTEGISNLEKPERVTAIAFDSPPVSDADQAQEPVVDNSTKQTVEYSLDEIRAFDEFCTAEFVEPVETVTAKAETANAESEPIFVENKEKSLWLADYARAVRIAESQGKMLLIFFRESGEKTDSNRFKTETLDNPSVRSKLLDYVCLELSLDACIVMDGKKSVLLKCDAFSEMVGRPGIAIIDYKHKDSRMFGSVVSTFPLTRSLWYTPEKMNVILDLPPGTLTQRTLIYAVRTHPEKPASTNGEENQILLNEAQKHSQYQADIHLQGHHQWDSRFQRISSLLGGLSPREVCAESWPGENIVEAAIDCVHCWRMSDGHWNAVRSPNRAFGYDMKRGTNGIWYATGIFGGRF